MTNFFFFYKNIGKYFNCITDILYRALLKMYLSIIIKIFWEAYTYLNLKYQKSIFRYIIHLDTLYNTAIICLKFRRL